jgi:translation initiation factor IF-2
MGRPAGEPDPARRARAAERVRSHATHQSRCSHLRGTSGFCGNFGQPQLPGCSATAGSSAVNSGSRNQGPSAVPAGQPMVPAGRPGQAHSRASRPGTARPGARPDLSRPAVPQCAPGINRRPPPPQLSGTRSRSPGAAHPRQGPHHANRPGARPLPFSSCKATRWLMPNPGSSTRNTRGSPAPSGCRPEHADPVPGSHDHCGQEPGRCAGPAGRGVAALLTMPEGQPVPGRRGSGWPAR